MDNLQPGSRLAFLSEMFPERNTDSDLDELTEALTADEIAELNDERNGKYDPEPTQRWPRE